jgi:asparagine synthase (glutamine-hydrolysing)
MQRADQPFVTASGNVAIVFNGEIYNHRELRAELRERGIRPRTTSDTEVVAELFERASMGVLDRIRGMYAFVVHDRRDGRTVLVRDPFGKKPLYYFRDRDCPVFASELSALLRHPRAPREPDPRAVADYLVLQAFPAPSTVIRNVYKVPPGSYIEVVDGRWREVIHWAPGLPLRRSHVPMAAAERGLEKELRGAVARRVESTAEPLGVLLSGGLDSSVVAALARDVTGSAPATFSIGFADAAFDESPAAAAVARYLGTAHHTLRLSTKDLADGVHRWFGSVDEPVADPSLLPTVLACALARSQVRAVLTGDGADELLLGYRFFEAERLLDGIERCVPAAVLSRLPALLRRLPVHNGNLPATTVARSLAKALGLPPERRFYAAKAPFQSAELRSLFHPDAWVEASTHRPFQRLDEIAVNHPHLSGLERTQLAVICHFLGDVILTKLDRASMLASLEARSPFLDEAVVDYCASLPQSLKLRRGTGKYLLRRIAARLLPPTIAHGVKQGFRAPVSALLAGELRPLLLDLITSENLSGHGLFRAAEARSLADDHFAGRADNSRGLWTLLCFQIWYHSVLIRDASPECAVEAPTLGDD